MAKIAKIGTVRIPCVALPSVALPAVGLRGTAGSGGGGYWPAGTPEAIRQACILWYDIARQGCTNEGMAADPVLRDLSGNGHDATCHNFAWSEESGISTSAYPGALVSDGVDDYAVVENAPILYNGKGFTIIAKREFLQSINKNPLSAIIADNRLETLDGAFLFEGLWTDTRALLNFGKAIYNQIFPELYSYMTSVEYNGEKILKGQIEHGSEKYTIFACDINNIIYPLSVALYSLLLFDRDLTEEEIEWVKTNMMQQ